MGDDKKMANVVYCVNWKPMLSHDDLVMRKYFSSQDAATAFQKTLVSNAQVWFGATNQVQPYCWLSSETVE